MKRIAVAATICIVFGTAGCSQSASSSGTSDTSKSASPTASASTSQSPSKSQSPSPSPSQTAPTANQVAVVLGCGYISTQTPVGTTPEATTMVKCSRNSQGYHILAYKNEAETTAAVASLQAQASGAGETMTIIKSPTWIVKAAEGPTVGEPMVKAAAKQGGTKVVLS